VVCGENGRMPAPIHDTPYSLRLYASEPRASDLVHGGWIEGRYVQPQNVASTESRATAGGWETVDTYSSGATEAHRMETRRSASGGESYVSTFEARDASGRLTSRYGDVTTSRPDGVTSTHSFGRR
jgi:hypothetical protein